jgi:cathepsin D
MQGNGHCPTNHHGPQKVRVYQENLEDNAYISDIYVGNPPQKLRALFDTGSTNTWVLNHKVVLPGNADKDYAYDDTKSCTAKKTTQRAMIQFGSGALAGHFLTDDMRIGSCEGQSTGQIHIKDQKFGNVEKQSTIFTGKNFEAIVGMAYPALAEKGVTPVFDEMIKQNLLQNNVFAFYLTSKSNEAMGLKSDLTLGYYDRAKFIGNIHWNDIKFKYMFGVDLDDVLINGKSTGLCEGRECLITFDSGTSLMSMPTFATEALNKQGVPTASKAVSCKSEKQFGELTLVIGGKKYVLDNDEWMFPAQSAGLAQSESQMMTFRKAGPLGPQIVAQVDSEDLTETKPTEGMNTQIETDESRLVHGGPMKCGSTIMTMNIARQMFLVGDVFMRKYYTIFDRENDRVGLALASTNQRVQALSGNKKATEVTPDMETFAQKTPVKK